MRILFPCDVNPYYDSSAIGNRYESLLNGLIENGITVHIVVLGGYNTWQEYSDCGQKFSNSKLEFSYPIFTFQNNIWLRRLNRFILSPLFDSVLFRKLKREYRNDYDYIWITGNLVLRKSVMNNLDFISKRSKTLIELSEFQNLFKINSEKTRRVNLKTENEYTEVTLELLKHINCFAIMTKTLLSYYKDLAQNPNAKFIHLPMTVDLERFNTVPSRNKWTNPYIAFTGTYTNLKDGVDILIRAFNEIQFEFPKHNLFLAGFYHPDALGQKELIRNFGLENRVNYLDILNKDEIPSFLKNADLLALPRPDSRQAQGGFPTKLGEYLATGNPICATTVGEIPDYLKDGESVYFAEPGSVDSFADAMQRALSNPEKAKKIGLNGRKVAEKHFNKDIQAKILYDFLKENLTSNHH